MRLLGRLLLALLVLPLLVWGGALALEGAEAWLTEDPERLERLAAAQTSIVYVLDEEDWTRFPLAGRQEAARVVTHADVPQDYAEDPEVEWRYALAFAFVGPGGEVLREVVQNYRTRILAVRESGTAAVRTTSAYVAGGEVPTSASVSVFDLASLEGVAEVRIRLASASPGIERVAARVYEQEPAGAREAAVAWERLPPEQRERLAQGAAYPAALLTAAERAAALRARWTPVGPSGVAGRDYVARSLLRLPEVEGEPVRSASLPPGLFVGPNQNATMRLPEGGAALVLSVAPVAHLGAAPSGVLGLRWYGRGPSERSVEEAAWSFEENEIALEYGGGLLEITSGQPVVVRPLTPAGEPFPADPIRLRTYLADAARAVTYAVLHLIEEPATPFRLDLRCACFEEAEGGAVAARWEGFDAEGEVVLADEIALRPEPSRFDRVSGREVERVSEPISLFFSLPPEVETLRVTGSRPLLVSAYNRPPDTPRLTRVPEDYFASDPEALELPTWFGLRPEDWRGLVADNRSVLVSLQSRPPEDDPMIAAGDYVWEQFTPEGDWLARDLLVPRAEGAVRRVALSSTFSLLPVGRETTVKAVSATPGAPARPEILYLRERSGPATLTIRADGEPWFTGQVASARGAVALPPLSEGEHVLEVSAPAGMEVRINQVLPLPDALIRRRAIRLSPGEAVFTFEKTAPGEELLAADLYATPGAPKRQRIAVTIEEGERDVGPFESWTVLDRLYDVRTGGEPPDVRVLGAADLAGPERTLFIPFGADLPSGAYRVRVSLLDGPEVYLSLTRTTPGVEARRGVVRERAREAELVAP